MLTILTNSYVSIAQTDAYILAHFLSTDTQYIVWNALSDADKEIHIRNALYDIESLEFIGYKLTSSQTLSFPRCYKDSSIFDITTKSDITFFSQSEVPDDVKNSQILEAIELASPSSDTDVYDAQNRAVVSYKIGHLSENFRQGDMLKNLKSLKARQLMKKYIGGVFDAR